MTELQPRWTIELYSWDQMSALQEGREAVPLAVGEIEPLNGWVPRQGEQLRGRVLFEQPGQCAAGPWRMFMRLVPPPDLPGPLPGLAPAGQNPLRTAAAGR